MRLYYMPGACSLAVHIALIEADVPFTLVEVNYENRTTENGEDFRALCPKGYVPALELPTGALLTETAVMLQFVSALAPDKVLLPDGYEDRLKAFEWLNFLATEIHKSFSPLFRPTTPSSFFKPGREHLCSRIDILDHALARHDYLAGRTFSLLDGYLFTLTRWLADQELEVASWQNLMRHFRLVGSRGSVRKALSSEGLVIA